MNAASVSHENRSSRLIICEKSGRWAAQLRRSQPSESRWVAETRSVVQWFDALSEHPASLSVIEAVATNFDAVYAALGRVGQEFPLTHSVIVADSLPSEALWALREAGAIHTVDALRRLDSVWRLWRQHARTFPPQAATEFDRIVAVLPWAD